MSFALGALTSVGLAAATPAITVIQKGRNFDPQSISVRAGDVVRFTNDDEFIHQIYVRTPGFSFDSNEQLPDNAIDIAFTKKGSFTVLCGIHPKMSLAVDVK